MKVKIAAFGTERTIDRLKYLTENREDIEILPFIYNKAEETRDLIEKVFACDFYLLTNPIAYLYAKDKIDRKRLPAIQVDYDPYTLLSSLYQLKTETGKTIREVAVDVTAERAVREIQNRLQMAQETIAYYLHDPLNPPNLNELISYFENLWKNNELDYVLTSTDEVVNALSEKNIPARVITPPDFNLLQAIEKGIALAQLEHTQNNQIITGKIVLKGLEDLKEQNENYKEDLLNNLSKIINRFIKRTDALLVQDKEDTFIIIGTDKLLAHLKNHYREFPLLQELKSTIKLPIHMGFGLGLNAKDSAENAVLAIESCKRSEHSICYIVNERQEVIGPIGIKKEIDTSSLYRALIHDARLNNELSYNFIDFITERNNEPFSTNDVALFYQVTKRSAERTVNKLLTGKVIKISGEERPYTKGRPRKLFILNQ